MNRSLAGLATAALLLSALPAAEAQLSGLHFNIAAGASLPNGELGNHHDIGYNAIVGLGFPQRGSPLGFRVEGMLNEFNESNASRSSRAVGVSGNATLDLNPPRPGASGNVFYGIGGIGYYGTRDAFEGNFSDSNVGWNLGGGFRFPLTGFSAYAEARYHTISNTEFHFTAISFGLAF